jgi:hypothetical protein
MSDIQAEACRPSVAGGMFDKMFDMLQLVGEIGKKGRQWMRLLSRFPQGEYPSLGEPQRPAANYFL